MTFLPIVDRELRVAARQRSTFWLRVVAALVTITISGTFLGIGGLIEMQGGFFPMSLGTALFGTLTWLSFTAATFAGVFFTSDILSEEKREGTLGLLFLTDLRGYDIVLGKLMAMSLRTFYALLAVLPIVGITLVMGGVTGTEFWQRIFALVNVLFFSLTAGIFISSISRESQKALGATAVFILVFVIGLPLLDLWIAYLKKAGFVPRLSYLSPWYVHYLAGSGAGKMFWWSLGITHFLAWIFLALASLCTPRAFHERPGGALERKSWLHSVRFGTDRGRTRRRHRLMAINPALWLAHRQRWRWLTLWVYAFGCVALGAWVICHYWTNKRANANFGLLMGMNIFLPVFIWALKFWMATQACRFFVESQKNGVLELLLASPLPERKIVNGQWKALVRLFFVPTAVMVGAQIVFHALQIHQLLDMHSGMGFAESEAFRQMASAILRPLIIFGDLAALAWFGMWMGMTIRRPNIAALLTLVFVWLIPLFAWGVLFTITQMTVGLWMLSRGNIWFTWLPTVAAGTLLIAKDVFFIVFARRRLHLRFRTVASEAVKPVWKPPAPALPQANLPPIIPSPQT